jgi:hypothetical protein
MPITRSSKIFKPPKYFPEPPNSRRPRSSSEDRIKPSETSETETKQTLFQREVKQEEDPFIKKNNEIKSKIKSFFSNEHGAKQLVFYLLSKQNDFFNEIESSEFKKMFEKYGDTIKLIEDANQIIVSEGIIDVDVIFRITLNQYFVYTFAVKEVISVPMMSLHPSKNTISEENRRINLAIWYNDSHIDEFGHELYYTSEDDDDADEFYQF